jgi:hypothetical protein
MLGPEYMGGRCVVTQCLPNPRLRCEPEAPAGAAATKRVRVPVIDAVSRSRRAGVVVSACRGLDIMCVEPVATETSASDGIVTFELPMGFQGYLQQTQASGYLPALYFLPHVTPPTDLYDDFPLLGSGVVADSLAMSLGGTLDPSRGHMMLVAEDCMSMPMSGLRFSSPQQDMKTIQFYMQDQLPSTTAMKTAEVGQAGYLNFPAGTAALKVEQVDTGLELSLISVIVRPGFVTVAFVAPKVR